jgi:hypothetical protein
MLNSSLLMVAFGQWRLRQGKMKKLRLHIKIRWGAERAGCCSEVA